MPVPNLGDTVEAQIIAHNALLQCGFEDISESDRERIMECAWTGRGSVELFDGNELIDPIKTSIMPKDIDAFKRFVPHRVMLGVTPTKTGNVKWGILLNLPINPVMNVDKKLSIFVNFETIPGLKEISLVYCDVTKGSEDDIKKAALLYALHGR